MLQAEFENRFYYFELIKATSDLIVVNMYKTEYALVKKEGQWENDSRNRMKATAGLIEAIVKSVQDK